MGDFIYFNAEGWIVPEGDPTARRMRPRPRRPSELGQPIPRATPANTRALRGRNRHYPHDGGPPTDLFMLLNLTEDDVALLRRAVMYAWTTHEVTDAETRRLNRMIDPVYQDIDEFRAGAIEPDDEE